MVYPNGRYSPGTMERLAACGVLYSRTVQKLIWLRQSRRALCEDGDITFLNRQNGGYPLVYRWKLDGEWYLIVINPMGEPRRSGRCRLGNRPVGPCGIVR